LLPSIGAYLGGFVAFYTAIPLKNYISWNLINSLPSDNGPLGSIANEVRLQNERMIKEKMNKDLDYYRIKLEESGINNGFLKELYVPVAVPELPEVAKKVQSPISSPANDNKNTL